MRRDTIIATIGVIIALLLLAVAVVVSDQPPNHCPYIQCK